MLVCSIVVIVWICVSFVAALAAGRFIVSSDRAWVTEVTQHTPTIGDSEAVSEETPSKYNRDRALEPSIS
jgi:hypothetical protein